MSLRERRKTATRHCTDCADSKILTAAGADFSVAKRCHRCFAKCSTCDGAGILFNRATDPLLNLSRPLRYPDAGVGVVFNSEPDRPPTTRPCPDCAPVDRRIGLYNRARIPRRFAGSVVEGFEEVSESAKKAKVQILRCLENFRPGDHGVALSGHVGTGKTHLLAAVVRHLTIERGIEARFIEFTHLLSDIKVGFEAGRSEGEIIGKLAAIPVLAIDELGKGLTTDWQMAVLDELISRRYDRDVTTFFATNFAYEALPVTDTPMSRSRDRFDRSTLEERIGSRMYSRLCGMTDMLRIEGSDYRRRS